MGAYMIFRKRFKKADEIRKMVGEISERYDDQYIDITIKGVGRVHCHTSIDNECEYEMTVHSNFIVDVEFSVDIDYDVDFENQEDEEEMFRRIAETKPFNELEVVMTYDESWDD